MASGFGSEGDTPQPADRRRAPKPVELLVVLGVIVLGVALLLPAVQASRERARRSQCNGNLKQIGLGLQNYGDVYKCFPADATWGDGSRRNDPSKPAPPYHYPWSVAILPFVEAHPIYDSINKRIPVMADPTAPGEFTGQYVSFQSRSKCDDRSNAKPSEKLLQAQQRPFARCPSDTLFSGPDEMPLNMAWSNYAAAEGVGYYPATLVETEDGSRPRGSAPKDQKGIFPFAEWSAFASIRDGTSMTIAVAEVTAASVCNQLTTASAYVTPQATPLVSYQGDIPNPPDWLAGETHGATGFPLVGGTGRPRSLLRTTTGDPAPLVFRAFWTAATTSVTGGAPCAGGQFFSGALGGPCGGDDGFELKSAGGDSAPLYGTAPTYNALYPPNSDWPGPDSAHPGAIIAVFADGHTQTIAQDIDYQIWASINTRAGSETINAEF